MVLNSLIYIALIIVVIIVIVVLLKFLFQVLFVAPISIENPESMIAKDILLG
jgi:5-bromo-4-chloroindolyl phosphate hydrolysis protein